MKIGELVHYWHHDSAELEPVLIVDKFRPKESETAMLLCLTEGGAEWIDSDDLYTTEEVRKAAEECWVR